MATHTASGSLIDVKTVPNLRDLGGWPVRGGGHVRHGVLYRSTALNFASDDDVERLGALGLRTVFDLRTANELDIDAHDIAMDLVITVDTSVAHLAGAMGKPVWILLPYNSDWRWLHDRDDSPWYPSAKLYRQQQPGNWEPVISQIKNDLRAANPWKPGRGPIAS